MEYKITALSCAQKRVYKTTVAMISRWGFGIFGEAIKAAVQFFSKVLRRGAFLGSV